MNNCDLGPAAMGAGYSALTCGGVPFSDACKEHPLSNVFQRKLSMPTSINVKEGEVLFADVSVAIARQMFCQACPYFATRNVVAWTSMAVV